MINRKGIISFLLITFGITYFMEGILILSGFRVTLIPTLIGQYTIIIAMWVPAVATLITTRFITHEKLDSTFFSFGPSWKPYLVTALVIPLVFIITYAITWAFGLGQPDWQLSSFFALIAGTSADMSTAPSPSLLLTQLFIVSLTLAPVINSIAGFGEEWGWRGYLLPRLMPLGKWSAYLLVGLIWGLWHAPLVAIGFNYPGYPVLGILLMVLLTTAISIYMNELTLRYKSAILAGWVHGVFNSQAYGIWRMLLFANTNTALGGITGLLGIAVLFITGLVTMLWFKRADARQLAMALEN
ncbi:MAG: CPBP family intramembrane metalloprotease [Anaerolineaceae bacterium]|nr:CPBP family intramembrane metalloprotease [Anaerolineaceae bacterium]